MSLISGLAGQFRGIEGPFWAISIGLRGPFMGREAHLGRREVYFWPKRPILEQFQGLGGPFRGKRPIFGLSRRLGGPFKLSMLTWSEISLT